MAGDRPADSVHLGFLQVVESDLGFVGGLLVTNRLGRPLEFQCTTPVRANRMQQILYGQTLRMFLFTDLIGRMLLSRVQVPPDVLLFDQEELLSLREETPCPVACLIADPESQELPDGTRMRFGRQWIRVHPEFAADLETLQEHVRLIPGDADLREPLQRVRMALEETLRPGAVA
jgi:hypothetical protein